jgi:uncharacterized membrane protein YeaQ/YmgE (transglycosylase-associated protein family)
VHEGHAAHLSYGMSGANVLPVDHRSTTVSGAPVKTPYSVESFFMSIIATIFIGLIVGLIARFLKPGRDPLGWIMTIILGIAGSFLAGYAGTAMGWYRPGETAGFIASVVGAIILLVIYSLVTRRN